MSTKSAAGPVVRHVVGPLLERFGIAGYLEVQDARTGSPRRVRVVVHEIDGERYVLSTYGTALWVRDLRAVGRGRLTFHGRSTPFVAVEVDATKRDEIIAFYRKRAPKPFQQDFDLRPDPDDHPAFRLDPDPDAATATASPGT